MKSRKLTHAGLGATAVAALTPVALPATAAAATTRTYKGALERTQYSNVQVSITVTGKTIRSVSVSANPTDQESQIVVARAGSGEPVVNVDGPDDR